MSVYIRKATPEDASRYAEIHERSWNFAYGSCVSYEELEKHTARFPLIWKMMLAKEPHDHHVIAAGEMRVGILSYGKARDQDLPEHAAEIIGLYLDPAYIGQGIGAEVMELVMADLKSAGFSTMVLWVLDQNYRAKSFYKKFGLVPDGAVKPSGLGERLEERYSTNL